MLPTITFPMLPGALCAGAPEPELWFPLDEDKQGGKAKAICRVCPARKACLTWAVDTGAAPGIWGGKTTDERHAMRPTRPVTPKAAPPRLTGRPPAHRGACPVCRTRQALRSDGTVGHHLRGGQRCDGTDQRVSAALADAASGGNR